jgi:2,3-bisphosphoglycerate-dependent phosphoglycerate mutase
VNSGLELWLVRHGETDWNAEGRVQGHEDIALNANGIAQGERLASRLNGQRFDAVYSSDLSRALETARSVAQKLEGRPSVRTDTRWREQHLGAAQGLTHDEITAQGITRPKTYLEAFAGGESRTQLLERVRDPLAELFAAHTGQRVLVVSHGGTLRAVIHLLMGDLEFRLRLYGFDNTAISRVQMTALDRGVLVTLNDGAHLEMRLPAASH